MVTWLSRLRQDERGNAAVEGCIYLTGLVLLTGLILLGGRVAVVHQALDHVAFQAARTASLQRDAGSARAMAVAAASDTLENQHLHCVSSGTDVDTSGFGAPLGQAASVTVVTHCRLDLSELVQVIPARTVTFSSTASSPIDSWRAR